MTLQTLNVFLRANASRTPGFTTTELFVMRLRPKTTQKLKTYFNSCNWNAKYFEKEPNKNQQMTICHCKEYIISLEQSRYYYHS